MTSNLNRMWAFVAFATICFRPPMLSAAGPASGISSTFDVGGGANEYFGPFVDTPYGLNNLNWVSREGSLTARSGSTAFMSANGNQATDFFGDGLRKNLGGVVAQQQYAVSFSVATYLALEGVELADFTTLRIGGPSGQMQWLQTPKPVADSTWVEWKGLYTPALADIGSPFFFHAIWNLDARHAIAIDGPVTATPIPEPATASLCIAAMVALTAITHRGRRLSSLAARRLSVVIAAPAGR